MRLSSACPVRRLASPFFFLLACAVLACGHLILGQTAPAAKSSGASPAAITGLETPLAFEASPASSTAGTSFAATGHGFGVELRTDGAQISLPQSSGDFRQVGIRWTGGNALVHPSSDLRQPGVSNYIPSSDPRTWRSNVPRWGRVNYSQVYPGIDLSFYGRDRLLEYDFRLQPKSDPNRIQIAIDGAEDARIDAQGDLELRAGESRIRMLKPVAYQLSASGERLPVTSHYQLAAMRDGRQWQLAFAVGPHDPAKELVIDPVLSYGLQPATIDSTVSGIAVDPTGNTFVTGVNQGKGFYLSKYDSKGTLVFNTVIAGGLVTSYPTAIAIDSSENAYIVGEALPGLPTTPNAYQPTSPSSKPNLTAPFVALIPPPGTTLSYLSYLGGTTSYDYGSGIAVNKSNEIFITGYESSTDFPTTSGAYLSTYPGGQYAAFAAKLDASKSGAASLVYSTLLGASGVSYTYGSAIAVDASGDAYVAVQSDPGYPTTSGAFAYTGGFSNAYTLNAYVTKVNPTGTALLYSANLGPGAITGIAIDTSLDAYTTGSVYAEDFPTTAGAYQTSYPGGFVSEINPAGSSLVYSTFLSGPSGATSPGSNTVFPQSIALTPGCTSACAAYIGGYTTAVDFPAVNAIQSAPAPNNLGPNAFIAEIAGNGASALLSTYLGGITATVAAPFSSPLYPTPAIDVDSSGNIYVAANVTAADVPITLPGVKPFPYSYLAKISPTAGSLLFAYPQSLDFDTYISGDVAVGVSSTLSGIPVPLLLRNLGSTAVTISSIKFTPSTQFSETDDCDMTIPAGGTCTLNLAFTPTSSGLQTATLSIASNASGSPLTVAISGTGQAEGYLQVSASTLTFPDTVLGGSAAGQTITVTNIGKSAVTLQPITLSSIRVNWGNGSDFLVLTNCPAQLAAAASCNIGVTFTPLAAGPRAASFYLQGNGFGSQEIYLYGEGVTSATQVNVALSANILNFNSQLIHTPSARQSITLNNTGSAPVSIYGVTIATAGETGTSDFSIFGGNCVSTSPVSVNPQASCSITVEYTPSVTGAQTGTLTITDSASGSPHVVSLTGIGLASSQALEFTPGGSVFTDTPVGVSSPTQTFYVYNTSTAPVIIDRTVVTGDFQVSSTNCPGLTLQPGPAPGVDHNFSYSCSVRLIFTPTAVGTRTGAITFTDTVSGTPQVLNLTGYGITATGVAFVEPAELNFGNQANGTTSVAQSFSIVNPGNSPITINNISTTGDYAIASNCASDSYPYVLTAQRTCTGTVTFTPTSTSNPRTGTIVVSTTAGSYTSALTGAGVTATNAVGITPTALDFGYIQEATTSFAYNVYLRNTGTTSATLTSGGGTVTGVYTFSPGTCGFTGNLLAPGASCYVQVSFAPISFSATALTGTLTLNTSAGVLTAALTGFGKATPPSTLLVPNGIAFDQVPVGSTSPSSIYVVFHNNAGSALTIKTAKTSSSSGFVIPPSGDACSGETLAAITGQCTVQVSFAPTAAGYFTGTLTIADSTNKTYVAALAGYSPAVSVSAFLDPNKLSFPGQVLTTFSNTQSISLNNSSDTPLTIGTLSIGGSSTSAEFTSVGPYGYDACSGQVVPARSKCSVSVAFGPTAAGSATGTISFPVTYSNSTTATLTASLSGTGLAIKNSAELSPVALNFQDQAVGAVTSAGADTPQTVTLKNTGNLPINIGALTGTNTVVGATAKGDFTTAAAFSGYDGCSNYSQLPPLSTCQITVAFNPAATGAKTGSVKFPVTYSNASTTTLTATFAGKGIADGSKVLVSPASGQFDVQVVGTTSDASETLVFNLTDTGNLPVKIATSTITSNFSFVSDSCSGTTLAINSVCQITVAFSPTKTGAITGTLTIPDNAAGAPHKVALSGTGIAASQQIVLSQTSIAFGNQVVTTKSPQVYVLVSNQSGATVPVSSVVLSGTNASDFLITDGCTGTSIYGHSNCQIVVQFFPAAGSLGARTAKITETDTATGSPRTITLTGTGIAAAPSVALYPASLNFGSQALGTKSAPLNFSVTNTGASSLTVTKVVSSNATEFPLSANLCTGQTIAPGANCLVSLSFHPNAGSTQTTTISVTDNATGSPQTLTASGLSVGVPKATLTPTGLTFASTKVGTPTAVQTITLSDPGTDTLDIAGIAVTGANTADFKQTNNCGASIVAGANCTISVTFDPIAVGSRSAAISVTDNAGNLTGSIQTASLTGSGVGVAKIAFSPTSESFASTDVGSSSAAKTVTISNPGTATLDISGISIVPTGDYTQTHTCGTTLAVGSTCTISVTFSPSVEGTRTAAISVADNAAASPQTVKLTGTAVGIAKASLSTAAIPFGDQAVGIVSPAQPVTLTNTGSGPLIVASLALSGKNPTDFADTSTTCPGTLAPAADCVINVTFKPSSAVAYSATLTITDNTGNVTGSTQTVTLTGTGAGTPQAKLSATTLTFSSDPVGTAEGPQSATLDNSGNGPLQVKSIVLSGANASDFLEFDTCQPTVATGGSCEIALYFIPTAPGTRTATVTVTDNANNVVDATQTISVTGTATGAPQVSLSASTLAFGTQKSNTQSAGKAITLTNTGNSTLTVTSVALSGTDPGDYSVFNSCTSVTEGSSCIAVVFFKPTTTGSRPATLIFTDNANNAAGAKQSVTLSGTGN